VSVAAIGRAPRAVCAGVALAVVCAAAAACVPAPAPAPVRAPTSQPTRAPAPLATPTLAPAALATPVAPATALPRIVAPPTLQSQTIATPAAAPMQTPPPTLELAEVPLLDGLLDGLLPDGSEGGPAYGLVLEDVGSGARTAVNDDQAFPSASLYKLGVAWFALRHVDAGTLALDDALPIEDADTVEAEPRGGFKAGDTPTVREALEAMLSVSSNAAAHAFLRVLGRGSLNQEMDRIGLAQTRVPDADDTEAVTSAGDMARLLRLISTSPELSVMSKEVLARGMANIAPPDALRDSLPDSVGILDKTGNLVDSSNVGALLETPRGTVIVVVLDSGVNPGEARAVIAEMGQIAYRALLE
jgi:beta-lactamase class A